MLLAVRFIDLSLFCFVKKDLGLYLSSISYSIKMQEPRQPLKASNDANKSDTSCQRESIRDEFSKHFIRFVVLFVVFCNGGGSSGCVT